MPACRRLFRALSNIGLDKSRPDNFPVGPTFSSIEAKIQADPGTEIEYCLAQLSIHVRLRMASRGDGFPYTSRQLVQQRGIVAHAFCELPPDGKVELLLRRSGNLTILFGNRGLDPFGGEFDQWPNCRGGLHGHTSRAMRQSQNRISSEASDICLWRLIARIVARIHVVDDPWSLSVKLHHGFTFDPDEVLHASFPKAIRAGWHRFRGILVDLLSHANVESARDHRDTLRLRVRVQGDLKPIRGLDAKDEGPLVRRISFKHSDLRSLR